MNPDFLPKNNLSGSNKKQIRADKRYREREPIHKKTFLKKVFNTSKPHETGI